MAFELKDNDPDVEEICEEIVINAKKGFFIVLNFS